MGKKILQFNGQVTVIQDIRLKIAAKHTHRFVPKTLPGLNWRWFYAALVRIITTIFCVK